MGMVAGEQIWKKKKFGTDQICTKKNFFFRVPDFSEQNKSGSVTKQKKLHLLGVIKKELKLVGFLSTRYRT
jgi:hypothetical protein